MNPRFRLCSLVFVFLFADGMPDYARATPRLWEVTGKNAQGVFGKFYILPVTHNGLEIEYDEYFQRKILPVALEADVFFREGAILVPEEVPSCTVSLADTHENRAILRHAYVDVERVAYEFRMPIPRETWMSDADWKGVEQAEHYFAHDPTTRLSEYGLVIAMQTLLFNRQLKKPETFPRVDYVPKADIANYIGYIRVQHGLKKNESIDRPSDLYEAYCAISPKRRGRYLQKQIAESDPAVFRPLTKEQLEQFKAEFVESIKRRTLSSFLDEEFNDEYDTHVVCDRNNTWLTAIEQGPPTGVNFYALGLAHVFQAGEKNPGRCDGLLHRLSQKGYTITLVD